MQTKRTTGPLLALLLLAAPASAEDVHSVASRDLFSFVARELPARLSGAYPIPRFGAEMMSCPVGQDVYADFKSVVANLQISSMTITPSSGQIDIAFSVNGRTEGDVDVELCPTGSAGCEIKLDVSAVPVKATLVPSIVNGRVKLQATTVSVALDTDNTEIELSGCGLVDNIGNLIIDYYDERIIGDLRQQIEDMARQEVLPELERELSAMTRVSEAIGNAHVTVVATGVKASTEGVEVWGTGQATPTRQSRCTLDPPSAGTPVSAPPSFGLRGEHLGLALSREMLQDWFTASWRAGMFCFRNRQAMGVTFNAWPPTMPVVELRGGTRAQVLVHVSGVVVELSGLVEASAKIDVELTLVLKVDPDQALVFADPAAQVQVVELVQADGALLDANRLIPELVATVLEQQIEQAVVYPRVLHEGGGELDSYYLRLVRSTASADYVYLYAVLFARAAADSKAPTVRMRTAPRGPVRPATYLFVAQGSDDLTPDELLRYRWRIDGGSWGDVGYSSRALVPLEEGTHTVEVAAVDLHDNVSAKPAQATVEVRADAELADAGTGGSGGGSGSGGGGAGGDAGPGGGGSAGDAGTDARDPASYSSDVVEGCGVAGAARTLPSMVLLLLPLLLLVPRERRRR